MKFLSSIRFDASDTAVYDLAAPEREWAIPGGFAFAEDTGEMLVGKRRQAFAHGFLSLAGFGRTTFVTVATIAPDVRAGLALALADHLVARYGAPGRDAALPAAEAELAFAEDLAAPLAPGAVLTVARELDEAGQIREAFRVIDRPGSCATGSVWQVVPA